MQAMANSCGSECTVDACSSVTEKVSLHIENTSIVLYLHLSVHLSLGPSVCLSIRNVCLSVQLFAKKGEKYGWGWGYNRIMTITGGYCTGSISDLSQHRHHAQVEVGWLSIFLRVALNLTFPRTKSYSWDKFDCNDNLTMWKCGVRHCALQWTGE